MTIEELKRQEFDSFLDDFKELISKHKESLLALKMGICFERYHISCTHYKKNEYAISTSGTVGITPVCEWYD